MNHEEMMQQVLKQFGDRETMNAHLLLMLSDTQQPTDITFYKYPPKIEVKVSEQLGAAVRGGAGPKKVQEILDAISLSDGTTIKLNDIWTICPMPVEGFTQEELDNVDMSAAEKPVGMGGETLRTIIRDTYHCKNLEEENKYLRRFIAS